MAENIKVLCDREDLVNVADAVRAKTNTSAEMTLNEMATKIGTITGGGGTDTSDATAIAEEIFAGETAYTADGKVTGTFTIDSELAEQNDLISQISTLVAQKANPSGGTDTSDATATAGDILSGKTAYVKGEKVTGTIASKTSSDLITSGATVTVPAGHYVSQATKSVATGSAKTPATTVTKNPTISVSTSGKITASVGGTQSVTPTVTAGYVSSGTAGTITVSGSATKQLTTKSATTYTPSTSNQTIASGTYLTGVQTIKGDTNLVAGNIKSGVSIFGVSGTYAGGSEDLSAELTEQANLIAQQQTLISNLETALENKAGGSGDGSVETCTVTLSFGANGSETTPDTSTGLVGSYCYTAYEDGEFFTVTNSESVQGPVILSNVVKNSFLFYPMHCPYLVNATKILSYGYSIDDDNAILHSWQCFIYDTKISLYNKTIKKVQNITYEDELLVWDFDNGCYTFAKPLWIKREEIALLYYHCIFENGIELNLVGSNGNCHAVFCLDDNCFEYANKCVGKMVMTDNGASKLVSCELKHEMVQFYNIITNYHINCYANGVLTSTKLNNIYPISDMKFVKEDRILIPYEKFNDIPEEYYYGLRLGEHKLENIDWISENVKFKLSKTKPKEV